MQYLKVTIILSAIKSIHRTTKFSLGKIYKVDHNEELFNNILLDMLITAIYFLTDIR